MKLLITGSKGQLGQSLQKLMPFELFDNVDMMDLPEFDITKENDVKNYLGENKPDIIINCAAYTDVNKAESDEDTARLVNAAGIKWLGKYSAIYGGKIIHISTDYVFDGSSNIPLTPEIATNPQSVYGKTKLEGEQWLMAENKNSIIIRTAWLYSPYGHNFLKTMLNLGQQKEQISVVYDQIGTPTYAFDLASAIIHIIKNMKNNPAFFSPGIYHFSNEGVCSWYDFAVMIFKIAGISCRVKPVLTNEFPTVAHRPAYSVLNNNAFCSAFDFEVPHWIEGLERCLQQLKMKKL